MIRQLLRQRINTYLRYQRCYSSTSDIKGIQIQPRLDYNYLSAHGPVIEQNIAQRKYDYIDMKHFKTQCEQRLSLYNKLSKLRATRNDLSLATKTATKQNAVAERDQLVSAGKSIKIEIKECEEQLRQIEAALLNQGLKIPNDTHPESPIGAEDNARIIKVIGEPRQEPWLKDHVHIANKLNILDLEQAAIASGSSFYYLQGMGAFLELALVQYAMHKAASHGFFAVLTPDLVRTPIVHGCGFQPRAGESSQIYDISPKSSDDSSGLCLAGTAEIPLAGKFATRLLNEADLPQKMVGFGHAFRVEAGGRGVETKGIYRVHQFSKVELFAVTTPSQSEAMMEELRSLQESIFTDLGLTFRILDMPTEELGASAYRKYDMEAWMPGRKAWGEISSTSNCTDYQSRRLSIRYRPKHQKDQNTLFCHTLNGTAMAVPRMIIAILETYQKADGSVEVPKAIRKWLPGEPDVLKPVV